MVCLVALTAMHDGAVAATNTTNATTTLVPTTRAANATGAPPLPSQVTDVTSGLSIGLKIGIGAATLLAVAGFVGLFLAARREVAPSLSTTEEALLELKAWPKAKNPFVTYDESAFHKI